MRKQLKLALKTTLPAGCLSRAAMEQIVASITVELPANLRIVQYSDTPPSDITLPWQKTDGCGGQAIGTVKHFKKGAWA